MTVNRLRFISKVLIVIQSTYIDDTKPTIMGRPTTVKLARGKLHFHLVVLSKTGLVLKSLSPQVTGSYRVELEARESRMTPTIIAVLVPSVVVLQLVRPNKF